MKALMRCKAPLYSTSEHAVCCLQAAEMLLKKGLLSDGALYRSASATQGSPTHKRLSSGGWQPAARSTASSQGGPELGIRDMLRQVRAAPVPLCLIG